jgi:SOS-response transcriptional repressor LexA
MEPLTWKQLAVWKYLAEFYEENGFPPTIRELCAHFNLKSSNTARFHLKSLQDKGYIKLHKGRPWHYHTEGSSPVKETDPYHWQDCSRVSDPCC